MRLITVLKHAGFFLVSFMLLWTHFGFAHRRNSPVDWETALRSVFPEALLGSILVIVVVIVAAALDEKKPKK